jgi:hypothetical protein
MTRSSIGFGCLLATLIGAAAFAQVGAAGVQQRISVSDVHGGKVQLVGKLGNRIGEFVTVEGGVPAEMLMMDSPVMIDTVDGKKLDKPVLITVRGTKGLTRGSRVAFRGYENCGMTGMAVDPQRPSDRMPQQLFGFDSWFEATSTIEPAGVTKG